VELFDFNADGTDDIFVVYANKSSGVTEKKTYGIEVWTFAEGTLVQLLHEGRVGMFSTVISPGWSSPPDCVVNVKRGWWSELGGCFSPIIQFYNDTDAGFLCTNLYYADGELIREEIQQKDGSYFMNNDVISESEWNGYIQSGANLLYGMYLSCSDYASAYLRLLSANELLPALQRRQRVISALADATPYEQAKPGRGGAGDTVGFYTLCLEEIDRTGCFDLLKRLNQGGFGGIADNYTGIDMMNAFLYDMNHDNIPELVFLFASVSHLYAFSNSELVNCGGAGGYPEIIYNNGSGALLAYGGRMGFYEATMITLEGTELKHEKVTEGEIGEGDYPTLEELGYGEFTEKYNYLEKRHPVEIWIVKINALKG